ncbi:MAG: radical SAM protein [Alphaproteobacteria bacterium]|nr:radical SAM protein [Alphaproteobacteria bacterium]
MNDLPAHLHLFIDLNDGCNLKCSMCGPRANLRDQKVLPPELFKSRVAPVFARVADFQLGCACEPLMLPYLGEALGLMRQYMRPDLRGQIITNGTLLKEETARILLDSSVLGKIRISIDGATAQTYEDIRKGARFAKVMDNVARLCELRTKGGHDVLVEFNYTVMRNNYAELPRLIHLASKLGVDSVTTHKLAPFDLRFIDEAFKRAVSASLDEAADMAKLLGVAFLSPDYRTESEFAAWERSACLAPRDGFRLDPEGFLTPQCHAAQKNGPVGNLLLQTIEEILSGGNFGHYRSCIDHPGLSQCDLCLHFGGA